MLFYKSLIVYLPLLCFIKFGICANGDSGNNPSKPAAKTFDKNFLKVVTADDRVGTNLKENDTSKYTLKTTGSFNNHLEYEIKSGGFCVAVKYGEEVVWATDPGNNTVFPKKVKVDPDNKTLWVVFDDYNFATFHFKETGRWEFVRDVSCGTAAEYKHPTTGPFAVAPSVPEDTTPAVPTGDQEPSVPVDDTTPSSPLQPSVPGKPVDTTPTTPVQDVVPVTPTEGRSYSNLSGEDALKLLLKDEFGVTDDTVLEDYVEFVKKSYNLSSFNFCDSSVRDTVKVLVQNEFNLGGTEGEQEPKDEDSTPVEGSTPAGPEEEPKPEEEQGESTPTGGEQEPVVPEPPVTPKPEEEQEQPVLPVTPSVPVTPKPVEDTTPSEPLQPSLPEKPVDTTPLTEDQVKEMLKALLKDEFGVTDEDALDGYLQFAEGSFKQQGANLVDVDLRKSDVRDLVLDLVQAEFNLERVKKPTPVVPVVPEPPSVPDQEPVDQKPEDTTPVTPSGPVDDSDVSGTPTYKYTFNYPRLFATKSDGTFEELNDDSYCSKYDQELNFLYYKFNESVKCTKVQYGEHLVWTHDKSELGEEYPVAIYFHRDILQVAVQFKEFYLVYKYKDNKFDFVLKNDNSDFSKNDLKIFTLDRSDKTKVNENDVSEYEIVSYYFVTRVFFMSGAMCSEVRYKDKLVWKNDYLAKDVYPKMVSYSITKRFFVDFDLDWYYVYKYDQGINEWVLEREETPEGVAPSVPEDTTPSVPAEDSTPTGPEPPVTPVGEDSKPEDATPVTPVVPVPEDSSTPSVPEDHKPAEPVDQKPVEDFKDALEELVKELDDEQKPPRQTADKNVKLITLEDDNDLKVNDTTKYDVEQVDPESRFNLYKYKFKTGVKLVAVYLAEYGFTMKKKLIWVYDPEVHGNRYPKKVYYNFTYKAVEVVLDDDWYYSYMYDNNTGGYKLSSRRLPTDIVIPVTPLTEDRVKEMFKGLVKDEFGVTDEDALDGYLQFVEASFKQQGTNLVDVDLRRPYLRKLVSDLLKKEFNLGGNEEPEKPAEPEEEEPSVPVTPTGGDQEPSVPEESVVPDQKPVEESTPSTPTEEPTPVVPEPPSVPDQEPVDQKPVEEDSAPKPEEEQGESTPTGGEQEPSVPEDSKPAEPVDQKPVEESTPSTPTEEPTPVVPEPPSVPDQEPVDQKPVEEDSAPKPEEEQGESTPTGGEQEPSVPEDSKPAEPVDQKPVEDTTPSTPATPTGGDQEQKKSVVLELDVSKKETTDQFEYKKEGKVHTWTAKEGYEFSKVKKGNDVLSTPTGSQNYVKVTLDATDPKNVSLNYEYKPTRVNVVFEDDEEEEEDEASDNSLRGSQ